MRLAARCSTACTAFVTRSCTTALDAPLHTTITPLISGATTCCTRGCWLPLSETICCTYDEYLEHSHQTMAFAEHTPNYTVLSQHTRIFRNIQIRIKHSEWVIISKNKSPVIHFVIRHPKMRKAIEDGLWQVLNEE